MRGEWGVLGRQEDIQDEEPSLRIDRQRCVGPELDGQLLSRQTIGLGDGRQRVAQGEDRLLAAGDRPEAQNREPGGVHARFSRHQDQ